MKFGKAWLRNIKWKRVAAAVILFLVEILLFLEPMGWTKDTETDYLTGEDSWILENQGTGEGYCQKFRPRYRNLQSIGVVVFTEADALEGGSMNLVISDADNEVVFQREIPYEEVSLSGYTDVEVDLTVPKRADYYMTVELSRDDAGHLPSLKVCSTDIYLAENKALTYQKPLDNVQLLTRYIYTDAISFSKRIKVLLLCAIAALAVTLGLPDKPKVRRIAGVVLLLAGPLILGRRLEMLTTYDSVYLPISFRWNLAIMYLMELTMLLFTRSTKAAVCIVNIFLTILYSADYYVYSFRGDPLRVHDLTAFRTAAKVARNYDFTPNSHLAMAWCLCITLVALGACTGVKRKVMEKKRRIAKYAITTVLSAAVLISSVYLFLYTDMLVK